MRRLKLNSNYDLVQLIKQKFEMRFAKNKQPQNNSLINNAEHKVIQSCLNVSKPN